MLTDMVSKVANYTILKKKQTMQRKKSLFFLIIILASAIVPLLQFWELLFYPFSPKHICHVLNLTFNIDDSPACTDLPLSVTSIMCSCR